jgi:hypothetical protein
MSDLPSPEDVCGCSQGYKRGSCPVCMNDGSGRHANTTIRWFGVRWSGNVCREAPHIDTPVGEPCIRCKKPIEALDQGITLPHLAADGAVSRSVFHRDCYIQSLMPCAGCSNCQPENRSQR